MDVDCEAFEDNKRELLEFLHGFFEVDGRISFSDIDLVSVGQVFVDQFQFYLYSFPPFILSPHLPLHFFLLDEMFLRLSIFLPFWICLLFPLYLIILTFILFMRFFFILFLFLVLVFILWWVLFFGLIFWFGVLTMLLFLSFFLFRVCPLAVVFDEFRFWRLGLFY